VIARLAKMSSGLIALWVAAVSLISVSLLVNPLAALGDAEPSPLMQQTKPEADAKSKGCRSCHGDIEAMHKSELVHLGCPDCHGGHPEGDAKGAAPGSPAYNDAKKAAHEPPRYPEAWARPGEPGSVGRPPRTYTLLNHESPAFIRFLNPGDLRVAEETCGQCHRDEVTRVQKSLMITSAMLWGGAAYNNGIVPGKHYIFGESYSPDGVPQKSDTVPTPTGSEKDRGVLPSLGPLPPWNVVAPPDPFRAFERGGKVDRSNVAEVGNPNLGPFVDEPGHPDMKLGTRELGTDLRTSAGVLNLHKTRLNDPHLSFLGTNDQPGDYRSSGCTACHVVYANNGNLVESGQYATAGHSGTYHGNDPTIPRGEPGHPIEHRLTRSIPTSQCMVCHMHQPNSFLNTYLGYQMWDYETDGDLLWPKAQRYPTVDAPTPFNATDSAAMFESLNRNPEEAAVRGMWTNERFLENVSTLPTKDTKFADYHGHGWIFRAVYKQDRKGTLLDEHDNPIDPDDPNKFDKAVHLRDIHLQKGMHCVDCHFEQDVHGDGNLYGEYPNAIEVRCQDCHGSINARASVLTSGPATPPGHTRLLDSLTPFGTRRFKWTNGTLIQRSMLDEKKWWKVKQVIDECNPNSEDRNEKGCWAKTVQTDGTTWGALPNSPDKLAHGDDRMACFTCHTSWVTSCFGCHLPQQANWKKDMQHFEGGASRNWTSYNPQVLRHDIFMLARHTKTKGGVYAPARSSSALILSSVNANRERIYMQQAPVSAEGYSSQAFNPHFPHTVRTKETRQCDDCHLSAAGNNNAWLAQVYTLGTNFVNFMGRYVWVGEGKEGIEAVAVTEWDEPQAVIGSNLHRLAYPTNYQKHLDHGMELQEAHEHGGTNIQSLQLRGEYLYTANGPDGLRVFDVANIDNKGFSERIVSAPVSPLGQRAYVKTKYATSVALPTNMPIHYGRQALLAKQYGEEFVRANGETPMSPIYRYAYVADRDEGLVVIDVDMLADGDPSNNFLERVATFNPDGALNGARYITIAGNYAYMLCARGLEIVGIEDPLHPHIVAEVGTPTLVGPRAIAIQFRYAFVVDERGLIVIDVTHPEQPAFAAAVDLVGAYDVYVARTYAYVAAGRHGMAIIDVEKPTQPVIHQMYDAGGQLKDTRAVRVAATDASVFAYVADGEYGLKVIQLISPGETPGAAGFSPAPTPRLIAQYCTHGAAIALSKGMDRDRAIDESGNQVSVFGRLGAHPLSRADIDRLISRDGEIFMVSNTNAGPRQTWVQPPAVTLREKIAVPSIEERLLPGRH